MSYRLLRTLCLGLITAPMLGCALGEGHGGGHAGAHTAMPDTRQAVEFPPAMREHTLTSMRDHLRALGEIQQALADADYDLAAHTAEHRLGMSSLDDHGAHEVAKFMPQGMQDAGTAMHRTASRFAEVARDASVSGDPRPAMAALAGLNKTCVACHDAYRLR
ncbi:MAG: hypothetical protein R3E83_18270 [Burkholderiaceae bacterium]